MTKKVSFACTSDYLKRVIDFDQPILAIGPGLIRYTEAGLVQGPMDVATIWFAEQLYGRKGRLDIFDLRAYSGEGGCHNPDKIADYFKRLKDVADIGEVNVKEADVRISTQFFARYSEPYGFIWDHGTFSDWITGRDKDLVFEHYQTSTTNSGKIAVCKGGYEHKQERFELSAERVIRLGEDSYETNLSLEQISLKTNDKISARIGEGKLKPTYDYSEIMEFGKRTKIFIS